MRSDGDLMAYVGARWPTLVRTLVLLGCPVPEAPDVATEALSRCRRGWGEASRDHDVDALVTGELLAAWDRRRKAGVAAAWSLDPEVGRALAGLDDEQRTTLVLTRYAGRPGPAAGPGPTEQDLRDAADEVVVLTPPTVDDLRALDRARRSRTTRRTLAVLVPVVLVLGGATWWTARDDSDPRDPAALPDVPTVQQRNPADVVWYADGKLHLADVVLTVPGVLDLASAGLGVVYGDDQGRVVLVDDDGTREVVGAKDPDQPLVADPASGLAAWVDPTASDGAAGRLEVYSVPRRALVGDRVLDAPEDHVIAVSGETVFFSNAEGTRAWQPTASPRPPDVVELARLVAAAGGTRVYQVADGVLRIERTAENVAFDRPGTGATLTTDGTVVLVSRVGFGRDPGENAPNPVLVDARTGARLRDGLDARYQRALAAQLGPGLSVTYVVGKPQPETAPGFVRTGPSGQLELRGCVIALHRCQLFATFPDSGAAPLLAS